MYLTIIGAHLSIRDAELYLEALSKWEMVHYSPYCLFSERKLQSNEVPHNLYIQNYSTASATCICLRRWLFSLQREISLCSSPDDPDQHALNFFFWQVIPPFRVRT